MDDTGQAVWTQKLDTPGAVSSDGEKIYVTNFEDTGLAISVWAGTETPPVTQPDSQDLNAGSELFEQIAGSICLLPVSAVGPPA